MKTIMLIFILSCLAVFHADAQAVSGEQLAERVATRLKDSLSLTGMQKDSLYAINLRLYQQSQTVRADSLPPEALQAELQQIENTRDPQYKLVLGVEKYLLYKQRKRTLVYSN